MNQPGGERWGRFASGSAAVRQVVLLALFGAATFLAGRLWSLREVREAQRQAGLAEQERLRFQAELTECRNALLLERARGNRPPEDGPAEVGTDTNRNWSSRNPAVRPGAFADGR